MPGTHNTRYRPIPQPPIPGRTLNRVLNKRVGLNQILVHALLRRLKRAAMPRPLRRAQALPVQPPAADWRLDPEEGYRRLDAAAVPGWPGVSGRCIQLFDAYKDRETTAGNPRKTFLHTLADADTLLRYPELVEFMLQRPLLDAARDYLGRLPQLAGAALWWTPPNDTATRSQLWHLDEEDRSQVKVLVPMTEVTAESGPFTFIPSAASARAVEAYNAGRTFGRWRRLGRLTDDMLAGCGVDPVDHAIAMTGSPGAGVIVDSSRCLHFGSRGNKVDRVVLMFHFLPWDTPGASTFRWKHRETIEGIRLDPLQQAVLGVAEPDGGLEMR